MGGFIFLVSKIPVEGWILLIALGAAVYFLNKHAKKSASHEEIPDPFHPQKFDRQLEYERIFQDVPLEETPAISTATAKRAYSLEKRSPIPVWEDQGSTSKLSQEPSFIPAPPKEAVHVQSLEERLLVPIPPSPHTRTQPIPVTPMPSPEAQNIDQQLKSEEILQAESLQERPIISPSTENRASPIECPLIPTRERQASASALQEELSTFILNPQPPREASKIPPAPEGYGLGKWIPAGEAITVSGIVIPGGMVYFGTSLPLRNGQQDPCLINPSKPVGAYGDPSLPINYWYSYSEISPSERHAYLNWLASGRKNPETDISYVLLFFYGLERRVLLNLIDSQKEPDSKKDWPAISIELKRLFTIYGGKSGSFQSYASNLLSIVDLPDLTTKLYEKPLPNFVRNYIEIPMHVRLALGQAALDDVPVPPQLALAWASLDPNIYLRTPATRCHNEFSELFLIRYPEIHGKGIRLPRNKTMLKSTYLPASTGLRGSGEIRYNFGEIPDVTILTGPLKKLNTVVDACTQELDAYSRYLGRNPESATSSEAIFQLPLVLWPEPYHLAIKNLREQIQSQMLVLSFSELFTQLTGSPQFSKGLVIKLAEILQPMDVGIEPNFLGGAKTPKPEDKAVLFSVPGNGVSYSDLPGYTAALFTLQLASAVAESDGKFCDSENFYLKSQVQSWSHLKEPQRKRLLAHLELLRHQPASLPGLKKIIAPLSNESRENLAGLLVVLAQSDGQVTPDELKILERIYKVLGLDEKKIFGDVHSASTSGAVSKAQNSGFSLDPKRIAKLHKDSAKVSELLAAVFVEEVAIVQPTIDPEIESEPEGNGLLGLDEAHSSLARKLLASPSWIREELQNIALDLDLMLDGALERINDAAFDMFDAPFFEGDDPIEINSEILERIKP